MPEGVDSPDSERGFVVANRRGERVDYQPKTTFRNLQEKILADETPESDRNTLREERDKLLQKMQDDWDLVTWGKIEKSVIGRVKRSKWDDMYEDLESLATRLEEDMQHTENYRDLSEITKKRIEGAVRGAVMMAAEETRVGGVENRERADSKTDFEDFLAKHAMTKEETKKARRRVDRGRILFRDIPVQLSGLVGEDLPEEMPWEREARMTRARAQQAPAAGAQPTVDQMAEAFARALGQERMKKEDFLRLEKWADHVYQFDASRPPAFYSEMGDTEKAEFEARVRLHHASYMKRKGGAGWTLEGVGKNNILEATTGANMDALWGIAGVKEGLHEYLTAIETPEAAEAVKFQKDGETCTLHDCKSEEDANAFRQAMIGRIGARAGFKIMAQVGEEIKERVMRQQGISELEAQALMISREYTTQINEEVKAQIEVAEHVALNLHFVANAFEAHQSKYEENTRRRPPKLGISWFAQTPLRDEMKPLDGLVSQLFTKRNKRSLKGKLSEWASRQTQISARKAGFVYDPKVGFDTVEIISDEDSKRKMENCWKISREKGKWKILVPECYPRINLNSYWEEVRMGMDKDKSVDVLVRIRGEQDINWGSKITYDWSTYILDASREATLLSASEGEFKEDFDQKLRKREKAEDWRLIRWMIYAYEGVDESQRLPKMLKSKYHKDVAVNVYSLRRRGGGRMPRNRLFFSWDDVRYRKRDSELVHA